MKYEATKGKNRRTWKTRATLPLFHRALGLGAIEIFIRERMGRGGRNTEAEKAEETSWETNSLVAR